MRNEMQNQITFGTMVVPVLFLTVVLTIILTYAQMMLGTRFEFLGGPFLAVLIRSAFISFVLSILGGMIFAKVVNAFR